MIARRSRKQLQLDWIVVLVVCSWVIRPWQPQRHEYFVFVGSPELSLFSATVSVDCLYVQQRIMLVDIPLVVFVEFNLFEGLFKFIIVVVLLVILVGLVRLTIFILVNVIVGTLDLFLFALKQKLLEELYILENWDEVYVDEHLVLVRKDVSYFDFPEILKFDYIYQIDINHHPTERGILWIYLLFRKSIGWFEICRLHLWKLCDINWFVSLIIWALEICVYIILDCHHIKLVYYIKQISTFLR